MKQLTITITYDSDLRELRSDLSGAGFVDAVPATIITAQQIDTVTLFENDVMSPYDQRAITMSLGRVLLSANLQLSQWAAAVATKDKGGQVAASDIDPVGIFDAALNPPQ